MSRPRAVNRVFGARSRPPIQRMQYLHSQLKEKKFPNCRKVAAKFEVSPKTIQRDIDFMRYNLELPIEYDQEHFGFYYSAPVSSFPSVAISEGELIALFVAKKVIEQYEHTPYKRQLETAFEKISAGLQEQISIHWDDLDAAISFRSAGVSQADLEIFKKISKAVLDSTEIEFEYKKLHSSKHEPRRIQPYHLGCVENQWYIFGLDLDREQIRTFALPRVRSVQLTRKTFQKPTSFSIAEFLSGSFGVFEGRGDYKIRIRFSEIAARVVSERLWHESQKLTNLPSGEVELTLQLRGLEEIEPWVLSWGPNARVLEPKELVMRLRRTGEALQELYRSPTIEPDGWRRSVASRQR